MLATSESYQSIIESRGHVVDVKVIAAGAEYGGESVVSAETARSLFEQDTVCIGSAVSGQLDLVLRDPGEIPKGARLTLWVRVRSGEQVSEWIPQGAYTIDTRETDAGTNTLTIHAFDDILRMEREWVPDQSLEFPMPMAAAAAEIARCYGLEIDQRSALRSDYTVDYPATGTTYRAVLRSIAAAHGGNWTMTDEGKLRLILLDDLDAESGYLVNESGRPIVFGGVALQVGDEGEGDYDGPADKVFVGTRAESVSAPPALEPVSKIVLLADNETSYEAGDDGGLTLEATCIYATQGMADDLLRRLKGFAYRPVSARDALIDPAAELGDGVTVNGVYTVLATMETTYDLLTASDIGAPGQREIESEIGTYTGPSTQILQRAMAQTRSEISKTQEQIMLSVTKEIEGLQSSISVELQEVTTKVEGLGDQYTQLKVALDGVTITDESGTTRIRGSSIETESIAAGAIRADQITLTGKITWGDLDTGVQGNINNRGISSATAKSIAHTTISEDLVESPTIKGAEIFGGAFYDLDGEAKLSLYAGAYGAAGLVLEGADGNSTAFHIYPSISDQQGVGTWFSGASLGLCGEDIFVVSKDSYSSSRLLVTFQSHSYSMLGSWNFSGATVTGLKIA